MQTCSQTQHYRQMIPLNFDYLPFQNTYLNMEEESEKLDAIKEMGKILEKALD